MTRSTASSRIAAYLRMLVDVEIALARAEARVGVIPATAADQIAKARADEIDIAALAKGTLRSGFPIIALVQELRKQVGADAAPYVHWGATTQDIMDTACVLQMRSAIELMRGRVTAIVKGLSALAETHRSTVLAGRTHSQQALPITFGLKVAAWLAPLLRHVERLRETRAAIAGRPVRRRGREPWRRSATRGLAVTQALAKELKLAVPVMPWHTQRDSLVEFAGWLSLVTGSLGKMAQDIILMAQTEVGEVGESGEQGRGGSSTMPQKSNPITSELILAAARTNAGVAGGAAQRADSRTRARHPWLAGRVANVAADDHAHRRRVETRGLSGGESASRLSRDERKYSERQRCDSCRSGGVCVGSSDAARAQAEELVKNACAVAVAENQPLVEVVRRLVGDSIPTGTIDWQALAKPENYLGEAANFIDAVLQQAKKLF